MVQLRGGIGGCGCSGTTRWGLGAVGVKPDGGNVTTAGLVASTAAASSTMVTVGVAMGVWA